MKFDHMLRNSVIGVLEEHLENLQAEQARFEAEMLKPEFATSQGTVNRVHRTLSEQVNRVRHIKSDFIAALGRMDIEG